MAGRWNIVYGSTEMPYGVLEYGARDSEGALWTFMQHLDGRSADER